MVHPATGQVGRQIESLFEGGSTAGLTDRQLLERFTTRHDTGADPAFSAMVARHGPMVLDICRQVLDDPHQAEDAFQAVFLILACKARSIRDPDLLGSWLHGVAIRTARKAKIRLGRRRRVGAMGGPDAATPVEPTTPPAEVSAMARERSEILHAEIARLPGPFRLPVILCYFEGLTLDQAAQRLQWPIGTVSSRLARARDKLRRGLTRRGVALPAAAIVAALDTRSTSASVPSQLCDSTTRAAMSLAAGQAAGGVASTLATTLAREVLRSMLLHKLKAVTLTLLLLGTIATGAGLLNPSLAMKGEPEGPPAGQPPLAAKLERPIMRPAAGRMFVIGRVVDPQRKPVPGAMTMVYARLKEPGRGDSLQRQMNAAPIGQARSDASGRFRLDVPRTSSARNDLFGAIAFAPGHGVGWVEIDPDAERPAADIILRPEQVIQGRLFDLHGRPARDVKVTVSSIDREVNGKREGPRLWWTHADDSPAWPRSATSDADGRFTLRGVGRNLGALLTVDDPRFARLNLRVVTDETSPSKQVTMALEPARIIAGRVTYADTGKPALHAPIDILAYKGAGHVNEFETDAEGRFRANPTSADRYSVTVSPPEGQPYMRVSRDLDWTRGAIEHPFDVVLPRGAVIHGKVTEAGSGKPLAGARVSYASPRVQDDKSGAWNSHSGTGLDGSFRFAVRPGPGYLVVQAPSDDYVLQEMRGRAEMGNLPGMRFYAHAFVAADMKPESTSLEVDVKLRRGVTVKGVLTGPDGESVPDASMISRVIIEPSPGAYRRWRARYQGVVREGHFELHGLAPDTEVPVFFLEPGRKLGATANLSGKPTGRLGPITVRLEPCGMAEARLVDPAGKPVAGYRDSYLVMLVVTPGLAAVSRKKEDEGRLVAHQGTLAEIDPTNYGTGPVSDTRGRIVFPALIPGATYRMIDRTSATADVGPQLRMEFTVKPGEKIDLGDILIAKPPAGK